MTLPNSIVKAGYQTFKQLQSQRRRLMLSLYGPPDSGKTEFALSAPGPGVLITLDRGIEGMALNPNPPDWRNADMFGVKAIGVPMATQMSQADYLKYWTDFYTEYKAALVNPDIRTVILDGDSDSWELQRLAEFGRLSKVPPNMYDNVNAARRVMYNRAFDSGKIFIATNRVRKVYIDKLNSKGEPELNNSGNVVRVWNGEYERQGFSDQDYLWQVHLRMDYDREKEKFSATITKCKPQRSLEGYSLEGDECNFQGLVQTIFPDVDLKTWGY